MKFWFPAYGILYIVIIPNESYTVEKYLADANRFQMLEDRKTVTHTYYLEDSENDSAYQCP